MANKVRFGVAGTNSITDWFLHGAMQDPRFSLTAVCSRSVDKAREFADKYGATECYSSINQMAQSPNVDAIYIAVPNNLHIDYALACMNAGKHVLCEKPAASNAKELCTMIECAKKNKVAFMEAMLPTTSPNYKIICDNINQLGKIRRYFASYCQYSSRYDKLKKGEAANVFTTTMSGGATMDIGVYTIYPMVAMFGMPQSISAQGILLPTGVDGQAAVNFAYPDMNATVLYSKISDSYLPAEIEGENGNLLASGINVIHDVTFIPHRAPMSGQGPEEKRREIGVKLEKSDYFYETEEFINVVNSHKQESALNSWENSLNTLKITDEIRRQLGVKFPADK